MRKFNKYGHASSALSRSTHSCRRLIFPEIYHEWLKGKERLKIEEIQHRKEFERPFFHEYILVRFDDGSRYRFDRRPDRMQPMDALRQLGSEAYDTVEPVIDIESAPHARSECIAALDFKDHCVARLSLILAVCSAISDDPEARRYTLREYNCYFFSWSIIATVARYCVAWESVPYDSNFLCLPGDRLSHTIAHGIMDELVNIVPHSVPSAFLTALPEMLIVNIPENVALPCECTNTHDGDSRQQLKLLLNAEPFKTKLSQIIQRQHQVIIQIFASPSNREELRSTIESIVRQANPQNYIDREDLSVILRQLLWQGDVIPVLSSSMDEWTTQWCTPDDTDRIVGGRAIWELVSNVIINWISRGVQSSASLQIAGLVDGLIADILGEATTLTLATHPAIAASRMLSIRDVINASILVITECNVRYAVNQVRKCMKVARAAIQDSIIHTVENLFPDELPIGLRIPKPQNFRLRQLIWLARPESAFCLWRTPSEVQNCDAVKHRELQRYLSGRIRAHSQDARVLGVESREVEARIRKAMSRIWLGVSEAIEGLDANLHKDTTEIGLIKLLSPEEKPGSEEG
ncbi:unnamed protein product [Rhizoctonia solani]|uniref:Uncharacterized protein n=1 Tax=Rhizoctonia solani TaxID=456999 RepID=A0A8H2XS95_9AGAM|nr:unnamed protein product [Rhizoctonia solani]